MTDLNPDLRPAPGFTVLHVAQPTDSGVANCVTEAAGDQQARGWRIVVACPGTGRLAADLAANGVAWVSWPATRSPGWRTMGETLRLWRLVRRIRPDVVHLHSAKAGLAGRLAVHGRLPTLYQPHGWSWLAVRGGTARAALAWERYATRWADLVVCVGAGEAALARDQRVRGRQVVVRNGVDLTRFAVAAAATRAACRERHGVAPEVPLAVCVGRVTRQKGQDLLLAAWPRVRQSHPRAELYVVGDGDLLPELRRLAAPGVRFAPAVTDARPWYAAADVVVLPSRWEGLSLTLLEALAVGRGVVASDISGISEVLSDDVGARVPLGDGPAMAAAITRRLGDASLRRGEGRAARHQVLDYDVRCTWEHLAAVTVDAARARGVREVRRNA